MKIDIVIPILNEEESLTKCLDSIIKFKTPVDVNFLIYIVDGGSTDNSLEIARKYSNENKNIIVKKNPKKIASAAMNLIINEGLGDYILRLDAGNIYNEDYLLNCIDTSLRKSAANVGGVINTIPSADNLSSHIVHKIMTHPFGVGNSIFRTGTENEIKVDTVPFGFFKKSIFKKIGLYDERLVRAQDYELNTRIINSGEDIWLNPKIKSDYIALPFWKYMKKNITIEGPYNAYMWYLQPSSFSVRHSITLFFSLGIIGGVFLSPFFNTIKIIFSIVLCIYFLISVLASFQISKKDKKYTYIIILPFCFFIFHFLHGLGVLRGVINLLLHRSPVQNKI